MTPNRVELGRAVTFMEYLAGLVCLISLPKSLNWNKIKIPASKFAEFCRACGK